MAPEDLRPRRRTATLHLAAVAAFTLAAVAFTWPLARHPRALLGATSGPGDAFLNVWVLGWDLQTISSRPAALLNGRIFDANIFYPATGTLAYTDHQIPQAIAVWPLWVVTHDLTLCYNTLLFASLVLSAWAMFAFVLAVIDDPGSAAIAGLIWGFAPFHFGHLIHLQLQALYFLPLLFLAAVRLLVRPTPGRGAALGAAAGAETLASIYWGLIGAAGAAVFLAVLAYGSGRVRDGRLIRACGLAAVVAVAVAATGVWPYWMAQRQAGFARNLYEASHGSAVTASYLQAPPTNVLYGRTGLLRPDDGRGRLSRKAGPEQDLFPGFSVLLLAGLGLARARRIDARLLARAVAVVGAAGFILSLGPDGLRPVYAALYNGVFGFQAIRAPARFSVLVLFALAVLSAMALARRGPWVASIAAVAIALEFLNGSIAYVAPPATSTLAGAWLRAAGTAGPVLYLPLTIDADNTRFMVESLQHRRPIVNGYSGQRPAFYPALVDVTSSFPSPDALLALRDIGVRFVVAPREIHSVGLSPLVERARFDGAIIYELAWTPEATRAVLESVDDPRPPDPGALPFKNGERLRFQARWLNGPMDVTAGEMTMSAERAPNGVRLSVTAATAPWLARFYEAEDTLDTVTDAELLPRTQQQRLHEGRRQTVKTATFDHGARQVVLQTGDASPLSLPLGAWARDPLSAFVYVRTLPLAEGLHVRVPVSDAGRAMMLDVRVVGAETISVGGRKVDAWRVEPRLSARVDRRPPPAIVVWVSRDDRRIPLRARVDADFASVEIDLVDSQTW